MTGRTNPERTARDHGAEDRATSAWASGQRAGLPAINQRKGKELLAGSLAGDRAGIEVGDNGAAFVAADPSASTATQRRMPMGPGGRDPGKDRTRVPRRRELGGGYSTLVTAYTADELEELESPPWPEVHIAVDEPAPPSPEERALLEQLNEALAAISRQGKAPRKRKRRKPRNPDHRTAEQVQRERAALGYLFDLKFGFVDDEAEDEYAAMAFDHYDDCGGPPEERTYEDPHIILDEAYLGLVFWSEVHHRTARMAGQLVADMPRYPATAKDWDDLEARVLPAVAIAYGEELASDPNNLAVVRDANGDALFRPWRDVDELLTAAVKAARRYQGVAYDLTPPPTWPACDNPEAHCTNPARAAKGGSCKPCYDAHRRGGKWRLKGAGIDR